MSRQASTFLPQNVAYSKSQTPVIDLRNGGQMGYVPDIGNYVSNQAHVRKNNLICLLLEAPTAFQNLDSPDIWVGTLRSLFEIQPLSITGLNQELTVETSDANPVGGAGQVQEEFTNITRARSTPTFRWNERYGMAIFRFLEGWMTYCMMDPESKVASVNTLPGRNVPDMLADRYSATCAFIQPDPTHTKVETSWLCTNMYPKRTGEQSGQRELTAAGEIMTLDIEFSALTQQGYGVNKACQDLLDLINITNANPLNREAFIKSVNADVAATTNGYATGIANLAAGQAPNV